ncbi:5-formyltetrahydrofolate cyclo-ligase [bacterium]|jgi:5-formyltetrahydrofolate cyclo-ligase|nr:5-formyltetrahydrofolate cyclo-ligase [bacterium]
MKELMKSYQDSASKSKLRKYIINKRKTLGFVSLKSMSRIISDSLLAYIIQDSSILNIGLYSSINSEVQTDYLYRKLLDLNKSIFYPKIVANEMSFVKVNNIDELEILSHNFREPKNFLPEDIDKIDLFIVPSVALGSSGARLGYGSGFYDYTLENISREKIFSIIFDFQFIENFEGEEHDIHASQIFTEIRTIKTN